MALDPQFETIGQKLHEALLTSPATLQACIDSMQSAGGLTLTDAQIQAVIVLIGEDLIDLLILDSFTYADLLSKHQGADPAKALAVLKASNRVALFRYQIDLAEAIISNGTTEYTALPTATKNAIPNVYALGLAGIDLLNKQITGLNTQLSNLLARRELVQ